jgi:hypothetical protein
MSSPYIKKLGDLSNTGAIGLTLEAISENDEGNKEKPMADLNF